ncbi:hypothetical protein A8990_10331 [Paenibacillus taihuensis]|uniref:Uncharacterized protein n=1 Tax=Paenibacillus taihuensis TaxID=1156355 RepID=A0A3D9SIP2_9BACL|nr:hypothetical protein [Paenibacillus taihuensis]REE92733.1 hypothetical protein A8990_10331 [Paenibacillus taihuensis]
MQRKCFYSRCGIPLFEASTSFKQSMRQQTSRTVRASWTSHDGWQILRFAYDDVSDRPRMCEQMLQQFMGCWLGGSRSSNGSIDDIIEAEILRHALRLDRPLRPRDVMELLQLSKKVTYQVLHRMTIKKKLLPAGEGVHKIRGYNVNR